MKKQEKSQRKKSQDLHLDADTHTFAHQKTHKNKIGNHNM